MLSMERFAEYIYRRFLQILQIKRREKVERRKRGGKRKNTLINGRKLCFLFFFFALQNFNFIIQLKCCHFLSNPLRKWCKMFLFFFHFFALPTNHWRKWLWLTEEEINKSFFALFIFFGYFNFSTIRFSFSFISSSKSMFFFFSPY